MLQLDWWLSSKKLQWIGLHSCFWCHTSKLHFVRKSVFLFMSSIKFPHFENFSSLPAYQGVSALNEVWQCLKLWPLQFEKKKLKAQRNSCNLLEIKSSQRISWAKQFLVKISFLNAFLVGFIWILFFSTYHILSGGFFLMKINGLPSFLHVTA